MLVTLVVFWKTQDNVVLLGFRASSCFSIVCRISPANSVTEMVWISVDNWCYSHPISTVKTTSTCEHVQMFWQEWSIVVLKSLWLCWRNTYHAQICRLLQDLEETLGSEITPFCVICSLTWWNWDKPNLIRIHKRSELPNSLCTFRRWVDSIWSNALLVRNHRSQLSR